ncbi:MAG: BTAD domain-containing putative transcriptional regulator [Streptosporangiaceae bacterium]|jgi:DNA-binding SARP family transcriptional activator
MRFAVLGTVRTEPVSHLPPRERTILAALLLNAGQVVSIRALSTAIWDNDPSPAARNTVQGQVKRLRRGLGPTAERIRTRPPGYLIEVRPGELDLDEFTRLRDQADTAARDGAWEQASELLSEALALWRGDPLSDIPSAYLRRTQLPRLTELRHEALEARIDADLHLRRHETIITELRGLVADTPYRERLWEQLMLALHRAGRQPEALDAYDEARRKLSTELGIDPGLRLTELHTRIMNADPTLVPSPHRTRPFAPRQLPADLHDFTGRTAELDHLTGIFSPAEAGPGSVTVVTITGPGGIGKSALAVRTAHLIADRFPDGQLHVDLAGTGADPVEPAEVLARLLRDLGVAAEDIPADAEERVTRYRSALAGRRVLLLLDDARNAAQIRPLLPGSAGCAVLVTGRARMPDLTANVRVYLPELDPGEGRELFARIVGADRAAAEPEATDEILRSCAGLPLAIRIAAARLAAHPDWSVRCMAEKLAAEQDRLAELRSGDMAVRASFRLSHACLPPAAARAFRLLGLVPPGTFGLAAAAALLDQDLPDSESLLGELIDMHMLEEPGPSRYRLHDLLRLFASELTDDNDEQAARRLIEWYTAGMRAATVTMAPGRRMPPGVPEDIAAQAREVPEFGSHREALTWCQTEEVAVLWSIRTAAARDWHDLAVAMASYAFQYFFIAGNPGLFELTQRLGADSARELGNELAYATLQGGRGVALVYAGDNDGAIAAFREGLEVRRRLGDPIGEVGGRNNIALVYQRQGRFKEALKELELCRKIGEETGNKMLVGTVLNNEAETCRLMGDLDEALTRYYAAIDVLAESGYRYMEGQAVSGLGETLRLLGLLDESLEELHRAMAIFDELGAANHEQIEGLERMAEALTGLGRAEEARQTWAKALAIAEQTGDSRAGEFRRRATGA